MMQVERWTLLIVREAMLRGITRFPDFQHSLGIAPDMLAARLDDLVSAQVFDVTESGDYVLSAKGWDLESAISALSSWTVRWAEPRVTDPHFTNTSSIVVSGRPSTPNIAQPTVSEDQDLGVLQQIVEAIVPAAAATETPPLAIEISLLGSFALRVGGQNVGPLSIGSQRLLVFLALHDRAVGRAAMAGRMWPEATEERAGISLRSALSRLDTPTRDAILTASAGLSLADTVVVDLRAAQSLARRLLQQGTEVRNADLTPHAIAALSSELLPDWYDDWVVAEAEDWRQLRLNALEALANVFIRQGRLADAAGAARAAIKVEPLRESAHATLIRVHLAEGNQSEAIRVFERYRALLVTALGLEPTVRLSELVRAINNRDSLAR